MIRMEVHFLAWSSGWLLRWGWVALSQPVGTGASAGARDQLAGRGGVLQGTRPHSLLRRIVFPKRAATAIPFLSWAQAFALSQVESALKFLNMPQNRPLDLGKN